MVSLPGEPTTLETHCTAGSVSVRPDVSCCVPPAARLRVTPPPWKFEKSSVSVVATGPLVGSLKVTWPKL